jgi:hypothetical protein
VRNRKGIAYLARLLERPHLEIPALELAGGQAETPQGDAGPMLDEEAKRAYRRRVDELREEIDEAQRWNDPERAERASAELDLLGAELSRAVGLGGRDRRAASNAERRPRERDTGDPLGDRSDRGPPRGARQPPGGLGRNRDPLPLRAEGRGRGGLAHRAFEPGVLTSRSPCDVRAGCFGPGLTTVRPPYHPR